MTDMDTSYEDLLIQLSREMSRLKDDRSVGAVFDGKFSLKWPTRIQGPNGDPYIIIRQAGGVLSSVPAAEYSADQWVDGDYWDWLPVGTIWQYEGSESDIPQGWYLCDGSNGTPDFTDKFILGGDFDTLGSAADEQATVIADHDAISAHAGATVAAHTVNTSTADIADTGTGTTVLTGVTLSSNHTVGQASAHDAISAHSVITDYYPAYYQLAFIKKVE